MLAGVAAASASIGLAPGAAADHTQAASPNDPLYRFQRGPRQVRAEQACHRSRGAGSLIAIVESGIDLSHPDPAGKVLAGRTYLGCAADGCGNGDWQSGPPGEGDRRPAGPPRHYSVQATAAASS